ncbi:hypothetical protein FOXG_16366 [Fusarium oxysporum f. sp. lycopersici 4287]|uniref:DUF7053 domain-containing protein n=1 Tax=Fusarium oxysporum f. sp. lycopersici (strain 4287 / CBS 123668 / FGSC 9935 / NRRL 34936) TaxID=426428 RepID=A0A0J9V094_FUSO4|nr:hypothetical protein FOXG_06779 [Fusarium oxysporum f. sp. lycopersici 4287]XP_018244711.1 hypothetical protein FOXG_07341 [Fusarium oxysporum f. sp. lycopersici 4287]XP_018257010.1 uncharacterized protein FOXG_16366 [Fusarium oxysporum f. sp. lycopersici 4287]KAJ9419204.1 hypothetical protein QL093DRAFT_2565347 [Fusarium oxysporum]KNB04740.1 hypothetical protein FOXG_06779 [Fusarium oxysporum f. sp. lycopersici 4287]KNB06666.1 hypothetical protein FOXG_07341 [Fusarium oxysporum f. sp. lyco
MRAQHHFSVTVPLPGNLPPQFLIGWLQKYTTTLKHNFSVLSFVEISTLPASIADDPFIGPWDATVRTYHIDELYTLIPGLTVRMQWSAVYKCVPGGIRLRVSAPNGNVIRSQWIVRPCWDGSTLTSPGSGSTSSSTVVEDMWELYDEGYLEGNRLIMPFSMSNDTELRELLTSPPGAIPYVLSATSFYLDISGSAPSIFPRTTDRLGCPDDIRSTLLLDIQDRCTLTLTFACSLTLPRPTTAALAARTTPAALSCSTFWVLWNLYEEQLTSKPSLYFPTFFILLLQEKPKNSSIRYETSFKFSAVQRELS